MGNDNQYTFLRVCRTFLKAILHTFVQWRMFIVYAASLTFLNALFGRWTYSCNTDIKYWCSFAPENRYIFIIYLLFYCGAVFYLFASFITDFKNSVFKDTLFKPRDMLCCVYYKMRMTLLLFIFTVSLILALSGAIYIIQKPADPDFIIEFCWFLLTFSLLLWPLFMIRCCACFAYYLQTGRLEIKKVFSNTSGRTHVSIVWFMLLMMTLLILNMRFMFDAIYVEQHYNYLFTAVAVEFLGSVFKFICLALYLLLFYSQYVQMEKNSAEKNMVLANDDNASGSLAITPTLYNALGKKKKHKIKSKAVSRKKRN